MGHQPADEQQTKENIIRKYSDMVYRLAFARTGSKYDADEIYQEVFLRFIKKNPKFEREEHAKAWFLRVTVNCANSFATSAWQKRTEGLQTEIPFETKEDEGVLEEMQKLPPKYREVLHLYYFEEMSAEEIAEALHRKNSTVRTQLVRARERLKEIMQEENKSW